MTAAQLQVAGGIVTLAGAGLFALAWATSVVLGNPVAADVEVGCWLAVPAHVLMLLGLGAVYLVQAAETGLWGLAGFLLAFTGVAIFVGYVIGGWEAAIPEPRLGPVACSGSPGSSSSPSSRGRRASCPLDGRSLVQRCTLYAGGVPAGPQDQPGMIALVGALGIAAGFAWAGLAMLHVE